MGIKGIHAEIGPGERISLAKLAVEKFEETGRPFRIAIDISIWQFQVQSGKGGANPALRTLYYRLLRLLSVSVQPLFVFDGPHKPPFKRNKMTGAGGGCLPNFLTKQMLKLFGFPFHTAPGEAEAECALLQREGIVDAVFSEDVDTLMFGCGLTLRNWSSEGSTRGNQTPTHVSVYHAKATKYGQAGLDREGMILVALMSGGDYITEGIPGCGIKLACQAARAGFGEALCKISRSDAASLASWRESLTHEVQTNESGHFKNKRKALQIPEHFPNPEVLGYYTHPVVSTTNKLTKLKEEINWDAELDVPGLRNFVAEAFGWVNKTGASKFIRGLAPALLVSKLRMHGEKCALSNDDIAITTKNETELVRAICGKRVHFTTDGLTELRLIYHPADIVGLDLDAELDDNNDYGRDGLAPLGALEYQSEEESTRSPSPTKRKLALYDPKTPEKIWVVETFVKIGVPLKAEDYEESLRNPIKAAKAKVAAKKAATKGGMPVGALDRFVTIGKPGIVSQQTEVTKILTKPSRGSQALPPIYLAPASELPPSMQAGSKEGALRPRREHFKILTDSRSTSVSNQKIPSKSTSKPTCSSRRQVPGNANPWALSQSSSQSWTSEILSPILGITKPSMGVSNSSKASSHQSSKPILRAEPKDIGRTSPSLGIKQSRPVTPPLSISTTSHIPIPSPKSRNLSCTQNNRRSPGALTKPPRTPSPNPNIENHTSHLLEFSSSSVVTREQKPSSPDSQLPLLEDLFSPPTRAQPQSIPSSPETKHTTSNLNNSNPGRHEVIDIQSSPASSQAGSSTQPLDTSIGGGDDDGVVTEEAEPRPQEDLLKLGLKKRTKAKRFLMLRDSLEGSWKEYTEEERDAALAVDGRTEKRGRGQRQMWRTSQVEVLDLTGD